MNKNQAAAAFAIAIPIAALFGLALVTDRTFAMRDAAHFYYPLFEWCSREWAAGRVPLWNPYENCGVPVLADTTSSLFYPGKLTFLLPIDFALRYKLYIVSHVILAAGGSYWLARAWKASSAAAALAAISYACGGNVVFQYCNVVFLVGAALLPFAALAIDRMVGTRSWKAAAALGVVLAMMILGGDPQAAYNTLLIAGLYTIILAVSKQDNEAPTCNAPSGNRAGIGTGGNRENGGSLKSRSETSSPLPLLPPVQSFDVSYRGSWFVRSPLIYRFGLIAVAALVGFLLSAVQILPSSEATKYSERAAYERPRNIYEAAAQLYSADTDLQPVGPPRGSSIAKGIFGEPDKGSHQDLAYDFSVGPWRLAEYFWPNINGKMFPTNRRWLGLLKVEQRTWSPTLYMGLLPAVLGIAGLRLRRGTARERWLTWLAILFTLASFGRYGVGWLLRELYGSVLHGDVSKLTVGSGVGGAYWLMVTLLPTYIYFRYPAKLLPLVSLALSQLAAGTWDRAFEQPRPKLARAINYFGAGSAVVGFVIWCVGPVVFAYLPMALFESPAKLDVAWGPFDPRGAFSDLLFAFAQAAGVAIAAVWLLRKAWLEPAKTSQWQIAALLLCAGELAAANSWLIVSAPADLWRSESAAAAAIRAAHESEDSTSAPLPPRVLRGGLKGIMASWRPAEFAVVSSRDRLAEMTQWEHDSLFPKYHLPSGISLVESYGSIKLMDYESLIFVAKQHGSPQPNKSVLPHAAALRLTGTEFLLLPADQEAKCGERIALEKPSDKWPEAMAVWKMKRTLPRAWLVHQVEALPATRFPLRVSAVDARTNAVLFPDNKARDFTRSAVVETDNPLPEWSTSPADGAASEGESCLIMHYDPQRIVVETDLAQPGLLVLAEAWYPGWKATVYSGGQSRETAIYRADRVLRGVWLPAGKQTVEFRFWPPSFVRGAWISGVSWFFVAMVGLAWATGWSFRKAGIGKVERKLMP